jgi:hypothetical protein
MAPLLGMQLKIEGVACLICSWLCCCHAESLPLFPGASEFDALQAAATSSSSQLNSRAER